MPSPRFQRRAGAGPGPSGCRGGALAGATRSAKEYDAVGTAFGAFVVRSSLAGRVTVTTNEVGGARARASPSLAGAGGADPRGGEVHVIVLVADGA